MSQTSMVLTKDITIAGGGGSQDHYLAIPDDGDWRVVSVVFVPRVAVAQHATNIWTVQIQATDGAAGTPESSMGGWSTVTTTGTAHVVNTIIEPTITSALAELVATGTILFNIDEGGTAATAFDGTFTVQLYKIP